MAADQKLASVTGFLRRVASALAVGNGMLLILVAALIASSPRVIRGVSCGHDFDFHLVSWFEAERSWSQGVLYPHWAQSPNWGAGEARFVFYPPLTWMLGAAFGYFLDWEWTPTALVFLFLVASGFATRALARQLLPAANATLAGALAACTPYALFTAYERTAIGELAAAAGIPLLLLLAWRQHDINSSPGPMGKQRFLQLRQAFDGSTALLALVLCLIWLSNAPAGVMASYLLAFAALAAAVLYREWWPVLRAAAAAALGIGLAAFYLLPAAWEQRWIAIKQAVDVGMRIQDSWLFARHGSSDLELHDQVLMVASIIAVFTAAAALSGLIVCLVRKQLHRKTRVFWLPLALSIPIIVLLQFKVSTPVWNLLPKLEFLQFPWRWLMVLGTPYAIFLAAATPLRTRRARLWAIVGWAAVLIIFAGTASLFFFQYCDEEDAVPNQFSVFDAGTGVEGTDEYAAIGSDNSLVASSLPDGCLVSDPTQELGVSDSGSEPDWYPEQRSCDATFTAKVWQNEHKVLQIDSDHDGFVILRLRRYPAWLVTVNGKPLSTAVISRIPPREDGLMEVPVAAGPSQQIDVRWSTTPDVLWSRRISFASLLLLLALWILERRLLRRRQSFTAIRLSSS